MVYLQEKKVSMALCKVNKHPSNMVSPSKIPDVFKAIPLSPIPP